MPAVCPHCHQVIAIVRLGVRLTPLKAAIFDAIKAAGDIGVTSQELIYAVYPENSRRSRHTIKAHVHQINDLIAGTDYEIASERTEGCGPEGHYYLRRVPIGRKQPTMCWLHRDGI